MTVIIGMTALTQLGCNPCINSEIYKISEKPYDEPTTHLVLPWTLAFHVTYKKEITLRIPRKAVPINKKFIFGPEFLKYTHNSSYSYSHDL